MIMLMVCNLSYSQTKRKLSDEERLNGYIETHTTSFSFNGQPPVGKGWDTLENLFATNQFVAWGEYHNSPILSNLTAYAIAAAAGYGYKKWCVETSPFVASELMRISGTVNPADTILRLFKQGYPKIGTFPFFSTTDDAQMLLAAHRHNFTIWGIDQEFQMTFSFGLSKVYHAQSAKVQQNYKTVYDSLQAQWWYPKTILLDSLIKAVPQKQNKAILNAIKVSKEIYRNQDNEARAALMKANFYNYYDAATKNEKVFFKLGSNHLAKGMNLQTNLYDIGNAVYELAQRNRTGFANVYIMARYTNENGVLTDDMLSKDHENPTVFSKLYDKEKWVLVDLRQLRLRHDNSLPENAYQIIEKYDFVLVSPEILTINGGN